DEVSVRLRDGRLELSGELDTDRDRDELVKQALARTGRGFRKLDASDLRVADQTEKPGIVDQTLVAAFADRATAELARKLVLEHSHAAPKKETIIDRANAGKLDEVVPADYLDDARKHLERGAALLIMSTPMLIDVMQMSAKVANVTKSDLATVLRTHFGTRVATPAVLLMVIPSVITMGADLLAMAAAMQLVTGVRYIYWVVPLAGVMAFVTIFLDYRLVSRYLLWLVAFMATYIVAAVLARPDVVSVIRSPLVPHISLSPDYMVAAVAMLGTT